MITVIFLDDNNEVVSILFRRNLELPPNLLGTWNTNTNQVELNDEGWNYFQANRNNIRKLKTIMDKLMKVPLQINPHENR